MSDHCSRPSRCRCENDCSVVISGTTRRPCVLSGVVGHAVSDGLVCFASQQLVTGDRAWQRSLHLRSPIHALWPISLHRWRISLGPTAGKFQYLWRKLTDRQTLSYIRLGNGQLVSRYRPISYPRTLGKISESHNARLGRGNISLYQDVDLNLVTTREVSGRLTTHSGRFLCIPGLRNATLWANGRVSSQLVQPTRRGVRSMRTLYSGMSGSSAYRGS